MTWVATFDNKTCQRALKWVDLYQAVIPCLFIHFGVFFWVQKHELVFEHGNGQWKIVFVFRDEPWKHSDIDVMSNVAISLYYFIMFACMNLSNFMGDVGKI